MERLEDIKKEYYDKGYNDAVNTILTELSYDPEHKNVIEYIKWKLKLKNNETFN